MRFLILLTSLIFAIPAFALEERPGRQGTTKTANTVLAGPTSGGAALPTFRALVDADIDNLSPTFTDLTIVTDDASNIGITTVLDITHTTSGTPAGGIGVGMDFNVETSAGNNEIGGQIEAFATDVSAGTEAFKMNFNVMNMGSIGTVATLDGAGTFTATDLGSLSEEITTLYLGDSAGIYFGADQDAQIQYDEATDDVVKITGADWYFSAVNVGIGTASPGYLLHVQGGEAGAITGAGQAVIENNADCRFTIASPSANNCILGFGDPSDAGVGQIVYNHASDYMRFDVAASERMRIDSSGELLIGKTSSAFGTAGIETQSTGTRFWVTTSGDSCITLNRTTNDGTMLAFFQDGSLEGTISVSGTTVSYNNFCGAHKAQFAYNATTEKNRRPNIKRGMIVETINALVKKDGAIKDRLPRVKISDTAGSKRVYGVMLGWQDNDGDNTVDNDLLVAGLGATVIRMAPGQHPQAGDLIDSNGDGYGRIQADDIIRSSTVGKITADKYKEMPDGSRLYPCVLYCG